MQRFTSIWDVTPDTAHPRARQILAKSIVWDYGDEDSPLGNDVGADTFAAYLNFKATQQVNDVQDFIQKQLASLGVPDKDWEILDEAQLAELLNADRGFAVLMRDDFIIGLAFAQLLVEGTVNPEVRHAAIIAICRQETDIVLSFRGGGGEDKRKIQLAGFRRVLELNE